MDSSDEALCGEQLEVVRWLLMRGADREKDGDNTVATAGLPLVWHRMNCLITDNPVRRTFASQKQIVVALYRTVPILTSNKTKIHVTLTT